MCYRVTCKQCNKYSWGGCGNHLAAVYAGIEKGKHCMCKPWPGVVILAEETAAKQQPYRALSANSATKAAGISATFAMEGISADGVVSSHSELQKMNSGERVLRYNKE
ncbi:hypothetical protein POTOM_028060 [Populus tomentosa]|uniref:Uncharacterized protein n=1 Tax=Populus tomentosa TaxID=118781 RepID=A0A8X7Z879_POPTO|nr:hypothetical protein POTOM_028060 [Populus tomentosa]